MKSKRLLLMLLMAFALPWAAFAQTLTVCDGTSTNRYIPMYGYYADTEGCNSEFIMPASELTAMIGKNITAMTFYLSSPASAAWGATFQVYMKEVSGTTLDGLNGPDGCTTVYTGALDGTGSTMDVNFTNDYSYQGGNLLIGFYVTSAGSYKDSYFYGIEATGAAYYSDGSWSSGAQNFLPKTTFAYQNPPACPKPSNLAATAFGQSATLTWTSDASSFRVAYSTDGTANPDDLTYTTVTTNSYTKDNLALDADHYFWVRAICSDTEQSPWAGPVSVHIGYCTPAPSSVDNNGISNVTFGTGDYVVNNETPKATYTDYSSQIGAVQAGVESTIAITFKTGYTYNTFVWVDLDNSLSFDADEVVCYGESGSSNPTTLTLNFTIPFDQTLGDFRLRIGSADSGLGSDPTAANPCYTGSYGCFQDYTLRVLEAPSCLTPTNLAVTTDGATATATWTGTAVDYNIDINGTVYNNVTSPYTFNVELSTTYTVMVQANCTGGETSDWTNPVSVTTPDCIGGHQIEYTLTDSYGDGWTGSTISAILVYEGCGDLVETITMPSGSTLSGTLTLCGDYYEFVWQAGQYPGECSFTFTEGGTTLFTKPSNATDGMVLYTLGTQAVPKPTGLAAGTPGARQVELNWTENGSATAWEICVNDDETNLIAARNNPFTLDRLTPDTEYTVKVRATDGTNESCWSDAITFTTAVLCPKPTNLAAGTPEAFQVELSWIENGSAAAWEICVNGDTENLIGVTENPYTLNRLDPDTEYTVKVRAVCGGDDGESQWSNTVSFTTAEACAKPTNLAETNITTNSATLSWDGTSESYVLQYRPWQQVGEDHLSTEEFVTYTYDLSEFKGQGSIAIRHYDVTDVFYLNVDNVELKADDESTIFFEDFESGSIPSTWTNYDVDGDGYTWDMAQTGSMNVIGNYGVYSASWISGVGALHPDNWLIISDVELGGTFSFAARGQDPNYPNENFAVYVSLESAVTEVSVNGTSYNAENLTPATSYAWQVKGICDEYQSNWVTSMFNTKDDVLIFATDGDWDDLANWTDVDGQAISELPTVERKVRVDADAIVPAGVVATAGKTTINGGSITVKDGGELKHNTATLWVTMEKDIEAYTIEQNDPVNNIQTDGWYFISTPFSGTTEIEASGAWSHVNNLAADNYDLYGFDPTAADEWINYKAEPEHAVFTAGNNHGLVFKRGYLYASDTDRTVTFTGTISKSVNNSTTETFDYDGTSTDRFNGWALVGNPFSCSAYINYVDGETVLDADYYVMNADGNGYELSQSSVALAPLTGAFINYSATGTVQFSTENNRAAQSGLLNMTVSQGRGNVDMARVRFGRGHNLKHMSFRNNSSKLFIPQDNDYAVVYTEDNVGEMPVSFKAEKNGTYSLSFNSQEVTFSYLHLIDNMTGNDVNLLETPSYTFNASTTDYANRFRLVFATGSTVDGENFGFVNAAGNLCIFGIEGEATVQVVDMLGHVLSSEQFSGSYEKSLNAAPGVYMIRLIQGNDMKVQKIVVR